MPPKSSSSTSRPHKRLKPINKKRRLSAQRASRQSSADQPKQRTTAPAVPKTHAALSPANPLPEVPWTVQRLKDETTGILSFALTFPDGTGGVGVVELGNELTIVQIVRELRRRTTALPREPRAAATFVSGLIEVAPAEYRINAHRSGWRGLGTAPTPLGNSPPVEFVTPGQTISQNAPRHRWHEFFNRSSSFGPASR